MAAADSTCSLKFGPEWIRVLSDSSAGQTSQPQPAQATPPRKYPLAKHRYGKEELIAIYEQTLYGVSVAPLSTPGFVYCDGVYIEQSQTPRSLIPMTDEEQRLWAFPRTATSRGRGRGLTSTPWAATRSVGGHLPQTRNWRSPEKPGSTNQSLMSTSSQFNYWRKNSLNEDDKVPEWADEKVSEEHEHVGSFDEKGGFLSLENRGRIMESNVVVSSSGNSSSSRSVPILEAGEPQTQTNADTVDVRLDLPKTAAVVVDPLSTSSSFKTERESIEEGVPKREMIQHDNSVEAHKVHSPNRILCAAVNSPPASSRKDDMVSPHCQPKKAQVVILGNPGTLDASMATPSISDQEVTPPVESEQSALQRSTQWNTPNRDISEALLWYYKDPQGIIQGPFSSTDMLEWSNQGYFHDNLECRRACDPAFHPLGALKKVWNGTLPFYMPNLHGPISGLLVHFVAATTPKVNAAVNQPDATIGLEVNPLSSRRGVNGFMPGSGAIAAGVPPVSPLAVLNSGIRTDASYFEERTPPQFGLLSHQSNYDGRNRQLAGEINLNASEHLDTPTPPHSRVQSEPEIRASATSSLAHSILESSIRHSLHNHTYNQTLNNHITSESSASSDHRRGIITNHLIEEVNVVTQSQSSGSATVTTTAAILEQQEKSSWFGNVPTNLNIGDFRGKILPSSINPLVDQTAQHGTISQHELPNSWMVQRKNERNVEISPENFSRQEEKTVSSEENSWNNFECDEQAELFDDKTDQQRQLHSQLAAQQLMEQEPLQQLVLETTLETNSNAEQQLQRQEQEVVIDEVPFEKVVEKKKKRDRKEKERQREDKLLREKKESEIDSRKQAALQNLTDEEADWDSGEQSPGRLGAYQDIIVPAPAPAIPAWGKADTKMSALSLQEIQRLEEERASRERQQRQQEAVKNGYQTGIKTWANAIAPIKSFDQIQKEQQASKTSGGTQSRQQSKGTPAVYPSMSAANVVANGITVPAKNSNTKNVGKMSSAQLVKNSIAQNSSSGSNIHQNNNIMVNNNKNNNNKNSANVISNDSNSSSSSSTNTSINNDNLVSSNHHTINSSSNNNADKSTIVTETTSNEQQLVDWCAQITKGIHSYLDMPTVVSILKDVESEAEIEDYVSQFFGDSLKEPRLFARQFVVKRAKFNVGLASSLPRQSEWCTTGGNKKRKSTKK